MQYVSRTINRADSTTPVTMPEQRKASGIARIPVPITHFNREMKASQLLGFMRNRSVYIYFYIILNSRQRLLHGSLLIGIVSVERRNGLAARKVKINSLLEAKETLTLRSKALDRPASGPDPAASAPLPDVISGNQEQHQQPEENKKRNEIKENRLALLTTISN